MILGYEWTKFQSNTWMLQIILTERKQKLPKKEYYVV